MKQRELLFEDQPDGVLPAGQRKGLVRGIVLVVLIVLGARVVGWTGAYTGAMLDVRILLGLNAPLESHAEDLREQLQNERSKEFLVLKAIMGDFSPVTKFDGQHYVSIIEEGYQYVPYTEVEQFDRMDQNIAFFPLYPMACAPLTHLMSTQAALVLGSNLFALAGAIIFFLWIRRRVDEHAALFGVACIFCWPAAAYFGFGYAESLTLFLTITTLYLLDLRAFLPAALVCGLTTATRPTAAPLVAVLMLTYWFNTPLPWRRRVVPVLSLALAGAAGAASYAGFLWIRFGSPFVYFTNFRVGWNPSTTRAEGYKLWLLAPIWDQFKHLGRVITRGDLLNLTNPFAWSMPFNLFVLFLSFAGLWFVPRRFRPFLLLGPLIFVQSYIAAGGANFGVEPMGRYMAVSAPAFVVLAAWATRVWKPWVRHLLLTFMILLQAAWAFRYGLGEWSS